MRFLARSLVGLLLTALSLGLAGYGGWRLVAVWQAEQAAAPRGGPAAERVYAVTVLDLAPRTVRPTLTAYGEIASARRLELRPARAGRLVELSPAFVEGGAVKRSDLLFRLDPAQAESDLARARIALADAEAELAEARRAETLADRDLDAARDQRALRDRALARQADLRDRGVGTEAAAEAAELAASAARQQVIARQQARATARARAAAAGIALRRARLAVSDAERTLAETELRAPFDGLLTEVQATPGRRVSVNEKLGVLVDMSRLEAAFRVSNAEYARLLDDSGALPAHPALVRLDLGETEADLPARLVRAGAAAGQGRTGRTLFARLSPEAGGLLREGDFVTVRVSEPALEGVAVLPAAAATEDGRILVVTGDGRLAERRTTILRRDGDRLIVRGAPWDRPVVAIRKPQLGPGLKVEIIETPEPDDGRAAARGAWSGGGARVASAGADFVALSDARRARLVRAVEADEGLDPADRARLLDWLSAPRAPRAVVERLEARRPDTGAAAGGPSGG